MLTAGGVAGRVIIEYAPRQAELAGDIIQHGVWRHLVGPERATRAAQVEEQQRVAEPGGVGALGSDGQEIVTAEREVAGNLALVGRWFEMPCPEVIPEQSLPRHRGSPPFWSEPMSGAVANGGPIGCPPSLV